MLFYFVFQHRNVFYLNYNIISSTPHFPSAPFRLQTPTFRFPFSPPHPYPAALFALCPTPIQTVPSIGEGSLWLRCRFASAGLRFAPSTAPKPNLPRIISKSTTNNPQPDNILNANHIPPVTNHHPFPRRSRSLPRSP